MSGSNPDRSAEVGGERAGVPNDDEDHPEARPQITDAPQPHGGKAKRLCGYD